VQRLGLLVNTSTFDIRPVYAAVRLLLSIAAKRTLQLAAAATSKVVYNLHGNWHSITTSLPASVTCMLGLIIARSKSQRCTLSNMDLYDPMHSANVCLSMPLSYYLTTWCTTDFAVLSTDHRDNRSVSSGAEDGEFNKIWTQTMEGKLFRCKFHCRTV
jgi:hypothetical protein